MNKTVITILGIIIVIILAFVIFWGRAEAPEENLTEVEAQGEVLSGSGEYEVLSEESDIEWEAGKTLIVNYKDNGTIDLKEGNIVVDNGEIVSGRLVFDMNTINATDTSNTENTPDRLTGHLKSDDFFGVDEFPEAVFELTNVQVQEGTNYDVTGDLTIRDVTESISFPVEIYMDGNEMVIDATVTVDRSLFNVRFGSGKFFENLGDNVIDDEFILDARIVASQQDSE